MNPRVFRAPGSDKLKLSDKLQFVAGSQDATMQD